MAGDITTAIEELEAAGDLYLQNWDLVEQGKLDGRIITDNLQSLAPLYLRADRLDEARQALERVRSTNGESSDVLLLTAELERKSGRDAEGLRLYQQGLRLRKETASEMPVFFGTNRREESGPERARFGGEVAETISLGTAEVLVPGGQFSDDSWLPSAAAPPIPVGRATSTDALILRQKQVLERAGFRQRARKRCAAARLYPASALVFIHGYNVGFDDALKRGAQLVRDLNFDGAAFVFSWPSRGDWWRYGTDRVTADRAAESLAQFLREVQSASRAAKVHVIAHSMGNRVVLPALAKAAENGGSGAPLKAGEIIFAAPAVPEPEFNAGVEALVKLGYKRLTLYASAIDKALQAGFWREGRKALAGAVRGGKPLLHEHVDSIDVSEAGEIGLTNLNHDVFTSNPAMTEDMRQLLQEGVRPPEKRLPWLQRREVEGREFWYYARPATAIVSDQGKAK
jgi:esterase/lipase superfamily enzyme